MHSCCEVRDSHLGCADWHPTKESKLTANSQPRDAGRCLRNIYNCFSHACQWFGKCLLHYVFWLLLCSNVCLSKHKIRGQQISGQISKSLLEFGPKLNDSFIASGFHGLSSTQHQLLGPVSNEEWDENPANRFQSQDLHWEILACVLATEEILCSYFATLEGIVLPSCLVSQDGGEEHGERWGSWHALFLHRWWTSFMSIHSLEEKMTLFLFWNKICFF